jgi:hypothetical protein
LFPSTAERMRVYEDTAIELATQAVEALDLGEGRARVTHLIAVSCTGLSAPGIDLQLLERCGLPPSVERTVVGFMGCYAAVNALKLARHIVRSDPEARVLIVSVELCTLHLQETQDLEQVLSFLVFGDGCAAALVSADPEGLRLDRFHAALLPEAAEQITWSIGDGGFDMFLSGQVPGSVARRSRRTARWSSTGRRWTRSTCGRSIRAGARCSTRCRRRWASRRGAGGLARGAARLRQHVLGHDPVRAGPHPGPREGGRARLRHGLRAGAHRRDPALHRGLTLERPSPSSILGA